MAVSYTHLSACQSYKKVPYLQDAEVLKQVNTQVSPVQDARLIPGDEVSILVEKWEGKCYRLVIQRQKRMEDVYKRQLYGNQWPGFSKEEVWLLLWLRKVWQILWLWKALRLWGTIKFHT